ncbi:hypothetical protein [Cyanophage BHS3]|nr:hypothetical protein [Cyanophage BHS3]
MNEQTFPLEQYGITPEAAQAFIDYLLSYEPIRSRFEFIDERRRYHALKPLRDEWGDDFESNFEKVRERFASLPPNLQGLYDNVDGARLLYQQIKKEQEAAAEAQQQQQQQASPPPTFDRGRTSNDISAGVASAYKYKQSDILRMPRDEYQRQAREIQAAYAEGLVDLSA